MSPPDGTAAAPSPGAASADAAPAPRRWFGLAWPSADLLAVVSVVAAVLPVVVATARAIADDWVAVGDNAYFGIRARDVLTGHHPWLGTWTSASQTVGINMNNPGPLYFDLLAIPSKLGGDAGLAAGIALLNIAAVVGIAVAARRQAGSRGVIVAMLAAAGLGWAMGSELLFDPWQPHSLLLPFLCFLVLIWALACGDVAVLPWAAGLASFIVQTHIGYALVVPALAAWGVAVAGLRFWRLRRTEPEPGAVAMLYVEPARRHMLQRYGLITLVVVLGCWAQSLYEQFFGTGQGNLSRLASSASETQARVGMGEAPRFVADVLALPPWWGRPSMSDAFAIDSTLPGLAPSLVGLAVVAALLVGATMVAWRRSDVPATGAAATGAAVFVVTLLAATTMPVADYGVAGHHLRWLWPVAVFVTMVVVLALLTTPEGRRSGRFSRFGVVAVTLATLALSVLSLPSMNAGLGPSADADSMPAMRELLPQLEVLRDETGVLFEVHGLRFAEPYSVPVMAELQRLGVPWYVDDPGMVRQLGEARAWPADASVRLFMLEGNAAREERPGARRIAFADGLSGAEAAALHGLRDELTPFITGGGLKLTERAAAEADDPGIVNPDVGGVSGEELRDPDYLFAAGSASSRYSRKLVYLVVEDRLDLAEVPERWTRALERYADLQQQADRVTVAVFAEPLGDT
jgi:hypothetical protein